MDEVLRLFEECRYDGPGDFNGTIKLEALLELRRLARESTKGRDLLDFTTMCTWYPEDRGQA